LFYHIKMRCFVVIDLKKGDFKPEYAGKMNRTGDPVLLFSN
jgi:predicted nuclease of restriction endonuclease-like (RecB) superfamily